MVKNLHFLVELDSGERRLVIAPNATAAFKVWMDFVDGARGKPKDWGRNVRISILHVTPTKATCAASK